MLDFLPSIAARVRVPRLAWRGDTGAARGGIESAAEIVRHEQARGRLLDLTPAFVAFLEGFAAAALLWVTFNRAHAARYGPPLRVEIDRRAYVIGEDGEGGFLLLFHDPETDDDTNPQLGLSDMKAPAEATEREMKEAAALYLASIDKPANQNSEGKPMTAIDTKAELAADRAADLEKRIGFLEGDTFAIPGRADEFAQRAQDFRNEQGQLSGNEKEAHGHDYAAGLALDLAAYKESAGNHDAAAMLTKEAEGRQEIAEALRGDEQGVKVDAAGKPPEKDGLLYTVKGSIAVDGVIEGVFWTDALPAKEALQFYAAEHGHDLIPLKEDNLLAPGQNVAMGSSDNMHFVATGRDYEDMAAKLANAERMAEDLNKGIGRHDPGFLAYDGPALTPDQPSEAGRAVNQYDALRQTHRDVDDEEAKKAASGPAYGEEPTRPTHIRATLAAEPAPDGTKSTRSTYLDPNENPTLPEQLHAAFEPQPMHPDDHAAKIEAAGLAAPEPDEAGREVTQRQQAAESTARQEGERREAAGEAPEPGQPTPTKERSAGEELADAMADMFDAPEPDAAEPAHSHTPTRGMD